MTSMVLVSITGHMVVATFFHYLFCIPFASSKHLAGHGSLPGWLTQTFLSEGSGPLVILPGLGCSFPLTLITGHDNTEKTARSLPDFHCGEAVRFPLGNQDDHSSQFLCLLIQRSPKWPGGS